LCNNRVITYYFGAGVDVIVDLGEGAFVSQHTESPLIAAIIEQPIEEVGEPQGWEILKSIVYGGLVESITSLGIVSSAVSSGATPCKFLSSFKLFSETLFKGEKWLIG